MKQNSTKPSDDTEDGIEDKTAEQSLFVFALSGEGTSLRAVREALRQEEYPISIGVEIAGEADDVQLDDPFWETAFVRWHEPELHDVWLLQRYQIGMDEEADAVRTQALQLAVNFPESAGKLIVMDHLRRTHTVYACEVLPAMIDNANFADDHPAWGAMSIALRELAMPTDGVIYAEGVAFYDADGEPLLAEDT